MRYASVCSGVEAASLAWMPLGWEAVWFSEIEPFPCAVLKERFPDVLNLGDMTEIKGEKYYGTVDLLVGGTPCQGFSVAGKQGGLNDSRSALCLAYCGLLETMRPRWFVWENVPGVFSTNQGDDFRAFLGKIDEIGYSVAWRVLDAQYVRVDGFPRAVPQRRRRVFVVGYLGDWRYPASVLFEPEGVHRDTPPRRTKRQSASAGSEGGSASTVWWDGSQKADTLTRTSDQQFIKSVEVSQSIVARMGTGGNNLPLVQECFPINSMVIGKNVKVGDRQTTGIGNAGDPLPTITSAHHHAVAVAENIIGRKENTGANGTGAQVELAYTQNATGVMGVSVNTSVRRLLPVECERLMGFPDNHTRIPWRGKPEEQCPDGPRYKACGNSMCVNVMRWIGMRIENLERRMKGN